MLFSLLGRGPSRGDQRFQPLFVPMRLLPPPKMTPCLWGASKMVCGLPVCPPLPHSSPLVSGV